MQSTMLLTLLAFLPNRLLAIPTESSSIDPSLLFDRAIGSSCSTPFGSGSCQKTSSCTTQGFHVAGHCPNDPTDVQCCVKETCSTDSGSGLCMNTDSTCSGKFVAGACPGPDSVQVRYNLLTREVVHPVLNVGIVLRQNWDYVSIRSSKSRPLYASVKQILELCGQGGDQEGHSAWLYASVRRGKRITLLR